MQTIGQDILGKGKWLTLSSLRYRDHQGTVRQWECVSRIPDRGAVAVVAVLEPSRRLVLIRQFRPPARAFVIEFPAGLIDAGEDPAETALRELREETGYIGEIRSVIPPCYNSPGLTDETVAIAMVSVNETIPGNQNPVAMPDGGENIETLLVSLDELDAFLTSERATGGKVDAKVAAFSAGAVLQQQMTILPR